VTTKPPDLEGAPRAARPPAPSFGRLVVLVAAILLAGTAWAKYKPYTWLDGDGRFYLNITKGLVRSGSLDQRGLHPASWYERPMGWNRNLGIAWSNISLGKDGTYFPKHSYVMPALMAPLYLALREPGSLLYNNLAILATVWLMFLLAREVASERAAAAATLAIFAGSLFLPSSYHFLADFTHAGFALAALLIGWRGRWGLAGLALGMSIWARPVNVAILPAATLLLTLRWPGRGPALRFAAGLAVPLALFAAFNTAMFGAPWVTAYQRVLVMKNNQRALGDHADLYTMPLLEGLARVFAKPGDGLVRGYPVVGVALLGLPILLWKHRRLGAVAALAMAGNVLSTAKFDVYHSRYYVLFVALAVMPLACLADLALCARAADAPPFWSRRRAFGAAGVVVLALVLTGVVTRWPRRPAEARGPTLSERVEELVVKRGDTPCDFWNGQHAAYECVGAESRDAGNLTGLVPSQARTAPGFAAARALWAVPGPRSRPLELRFPRTTPGAGGFALTVAATNECAGLPFEVDAELGGARESIRLEKRGQVVRRTLRPRRSAPADLVLKLLAGRGGRARGLVIDGWPR
jgi:hypothetical protein